MIFSSSLVVLCSALCAHATTFQPSGIPFKGPVTTPSGLSAFVVFSNLTTPRGIAFDELGNLLVVERGLGISVLTEVQGGWERELVINNTDFTHGIVVDGGRIFASTATTIITHFWDPETRTVTDAFPAVTGLPGDGELTTHTFLLDRDADNVVRGYLVGSGPLTNIDLTARDPASGRSQIRRLKLPEVQITIFPPPPIGWPGDSDDLVAFGIRNPAGFAVRDGGLYVVENAASIDNITGFEGDFANDNPADELNFVDLSAEAKSYGFPDCSTVWNPLGRPGLAKGDQFSLNLDGTRDDAFCKQKANNEPPVLDFQAHSVPLDIKFYDRSKAKEGSAGLPARFDGDAFVSFHGSFNRAPPTGYGVVRVPFPLNGDDYELIVQAQNLAACPDQGRCIRPVGLDFDKKGRLFVSSDSSGEVFVIQASK